MLELKHDAFTRASLLKKMACSNLKGFKVSPGASDRWICVRRVDHPKQI
jgi:hypothetical protein